MIQTTRLVLRPWHEDDRSAFASLNRDPIVTFDLGGPLDQAASDAKFDRYIANFRRTGFGRFAIESKQGEFLGYAGLNPIRPDLPISPGWEIGWRLNRDFWGYGFATEAAQALLEDGFKRLDVPEILAFTASDNRRSAAVMERLAMRRDRTRDFTAQYGNGSWHGQVWVIGRP
jgi:RimJ/RimL family protein N-acetyltransferase